MDRDLAAYLDWLRGSGVDFAVDDPLPKDGDHDGALRGGEAGAAYFAIPGHLPVLEYREPSVALAADHASVAVALVLLRGGVVEAGARFWDIGCGTGVLTVVGGRLGAAEIHATDVEPQAVALAQHTCAAAGVQARFEVGSLLDPIPHDAVADVVIANLPHKPVPAGVDLTICQRGGEDGAQVHGDFCHAVRGRLAPGGRVLFFLHSLPHPRLLRCYGAHFDLRLRSWKRRWFQPGEYGPLQEHFSRRAREGRSFVVERDGRRFLIAGVWEARER